MRKPSSDLERRLAGVRMVLMDIDGTLVTSDSETFDNVSSQLRRLRRFGVPFSVATGRTISGALPILERLRSSVGVRTAPMVNYNGAVLLSAHDLTLIERHVVPKTSLFRALSTCRSVGLWPIVYTCRDAVTGPPIESVYVEWDAPASMEFNGMRVERVPNLLDVASDVVAVLADAGDVESSGRLARELDKRVGNDIRVSTSGSRYIEICAPNATKLHAMQRIAALALISVEQVMAIGDNLNDLDMIEAAGVGVAVNNAPAEVKSVAAYACNRASAEGVVEALRMLVRVLSLGGHTSTGGVDCRANRTKRERPRTRVLGAY